MVGRTRAAIGAVLAVAACGRAPAASGTDAAGDAPARRDANAIADGGATNLDWTWAFSDGGGCPDGVDRVQIFTAQWQIDGVEYRGAPSDPTTIPCAYGAGGVLVDAGGEYDSWIRLLTTDDRVYAVTGPVHVDVGTVASTVIDVPRGWVHVSWLLYGQTSGHALACSDVPALNGAGMGAVELFPGVSGQATPLDTQLCAAAATWLGLPAGTYDLTMRAVYSQTYLPAGGPDVYNLGATTFAGQTVTDGTLELGAQQLVLAQY